MKYLLIAAIFNLPPSEVTPRACAPAFVKSWQDNRPEAMRHLPRRACRYQTDTGTYVCSRDGCTRAAR